MSDNNFGRRRHDPEDTAEIVGILQGNKEALERVAMVSHMSHSRIISLAIQHFGSLSLKEQLEIAEKYLTH